MREGDRCTGAARPGTYTALVPVVLESWSGPSAGREREVMGAPQFISPAERRRWQRAGSPLPGTFDPKARRARRQDDVFLIKGGGRVLEARRGVYDVRTPEAARSRLRSQQGAPAGEQAADPPRSAPPRGPAQHHQGSRQRGREADERRRDHRGPLRHPQQSRRDPEAPRRHLRTPSPKECPGIEVKTHATDLAGRKGDAIVFDDKDGFEDEYIFDPDTTAVLGERSVLVHPDDRIWQDKGLPPGLVFRDSAYLRSAVVDSTRQRGSAPPRWRVLSRGAGRKRASGSSRARDYPSTARPGPRPICNPRMCSWRSMRMGPVPPRCLPRTGNGPI